MKKLITNNGLILGMKYTIIPLVLLLVVLSYSFSVTEVIFNDTFENTTYSNSVWTIQPGWYITIVDGLHNSMYSLYSFNTGGFENATVNISTLGYKNIEVSWIEYRHRGTSTLSVEEVRSYYTTSNGTTLLIDDTSPYDVLSYRHFYLGSDADNSSFNFTISAESTIGSYTIFDNFVVTGEVISYKPIVNNYGYTDSTYTNDYICVWVNATGQYADNVSYAVANVTAPNGNTFLVRLTDDGKCNIIQNHDNDNMYAGEFYTGSEYGNYTINSITVYSITGNKTVVPINSNVTVIRPMIWYYTNITNVYQNYTMTMDAKICSSYLIGKNIYNYIINLPYYMQPKTIIYPGGTIVQVTQNNLIIDKGEKSIIVDGVYIPPKSCVDIYIDGVNSMAVVGALQNINNYTDYLVNSAYEMYNNYLINVVSLDDNTTLNYTLSQMSYSNNILKSMINSQSYINGTYAQPEDYISLYQTILNDYQIVLGIYNKYRNINQESMLNNIELTLTYINQTLLNMNNTLNELNNTLNYVKNKSDLTYNDVELIKNYTISIKSDTLRILSNLSALNQTEYNRYVDILNRIDSDTNNVLLAVYNLTDYLGYNQSTEKLRYDILTIQNYLNDIKAQEDSIYYLNTQINATVNNINSTSNNIMSNLTYEINMIKSMYNCTYTSNNSICYKLDKLLYDVQNLNSTSNENTNKILSDIKDINQSLGCENGYNSKICKILESINKKIPQPSQPVQLPTIQDVINEKLQYINEQLYKIKDTILNWLNSFTNYIREVV